MKVSKTTKTLFLIVVFCFTMLFITFDVLLFTSSSNKDSKPCIWAGYAEGSIIDYRLKVYVDSTFYLSSTNNHKTKKWKLVLDTLFLLEEMEVQAKIVDNKLIECNNPEYRSLSIMTIKKFEPAKVIDFYKKK